MVAADGEAAIDLLLKQSEPFDAVVLDVMLPGWMDLPLLALCVLRRTTLRY